MTGLGRGVATGAAHAVEVVVRSVNHRNREVSLKLRDALAALEPELRRRAGEAVTRGKVDVSVHVRALTEGRGRLAVDEELLRELAMRLRPLAAELGQTDIGLGALLALPGVVGAAGEEDDGSGSDAELAALVGDAFAAALAELDSMRLREGEALHAELASRLDTVERLAGELTVHAEGLGERLLSTLRARLEKLVAGLDLDPSRLHQEAAMLAERADVGEELARIASHLAQFRGALAAGGPVGKRLDFLAQELHREINTLGAKLRELAALPLVLDLKGEVERIREQVQNVE